MALPDNHYATCKYCKQEMRPGVACTFNYYEIDGKLYKRDTKGFGNEICHDCGAPQGGAHHPGCDEERCPVCGGQAIGCEHLRKSYLVRKENK